MGNDIWDWTKEWRRKRHEEAFRVGKEKAEQANLSDQVLHDLGDVVTVLAPGTSEHESEEAGYHAYTRGEDKEREQPSPAGNGSGGEALGGGFVLLLIAPLYAMFLIFKAIILSIERRSITPLFEGIAGACACVGIFCTVFGIIWALCLWVASGNPGGLRSQAVVWNEFFWGISITAWTVFALMVWLQKKSKTSEGSQSRITKDQVRKPFDSSVDSDSSPSSRSSSRKGNLAGWLVGISFMFIAPKIVARIVIAIFPESMNWGLHPLLALPLLFLFPFGPAILIGRAVARHMNAK